ncbi:MAG TPA: hypothetical protein VF178_17105 [Gemmatimonadaceae bacterium]
MRYPSRSRTVVLDLAGCLVEEDFVGTDGHASQSFASFDFRPGAWYRAYVNGQGVSLLLSGGLENDAMVMTGVLSGPGNSERHVRLTLRPEGTDRVVQRIETSGNGKHWSIQETLIYVRE